MRVLNRSKLLNAWKAELLVGYSGIQFIVDKKGNKTGVLIDLKKHKELWEDTNPIHHPI